MTASLPKFSVVIPTRGDHDLSEILDAYAGKADEVIVWDNSHRSDLSVYGRYAAIKEARNDLILTQDDDCLVPDFEKLFPVWNQEEGIVCNMPESRWADYPDSCLVGWGAVFHRDLPIWAFEWMGSKWAVDKKLFLDLCDVIFTTLVKNTKIDIGFSHLPWAEGPDRMFKQPGHRERMDKMVALARKIRDS